MDDDLIRFLSITADTVFQGSDIGGLPLSYSFPVPKHRFWTASHSHAWLIVNLVTIIRLCFLPQG